MSIFRYYKILRGLSTIRLHKNTSDKLFVIGNGPSCAIDIEEWRNDLQKNDCVMVNFMANTELFEEIKPCVYVLADPWFFADYTTLPSDQVEKYQLLRESLISKTKWKMELVVSDKYRKANIVKFVMQNPNITVRYFRSAYSFKIPASRVLMWGWRTNRIGPPLQNVINAATYLGVFWQYREVYLLGIDTSMHMMPRIEQETNRFYIEDQHFYGTERCYLDFTMRRWLSSCANTFACYEYLAKFAKNRGVRIFNASKNSFVDAFERIRKT